MGVLLNWRLERLSGERGVVPIWLADVFFCGILHEPANVSTFCLLPKTKALRLRGRFLILSAFAFGHFFLCHFAALRDWSALGHFFLGRLSLFCHKNFSFHKFVAEINFIAKIHEIIFIFIDLKVLYVYYKLFSRYKQYFF